MHLKSRSKVLRVSYAFIGATQSDSIAGGQWTLTSSLIEAVQGKAGLDRYQDGVIDFADFVVDTKLENKNTYNRHTQYRNDVLNLKDLFVNIYKSHSIIWKQSNQFKSRNSINLKSNHSKQINTKQPKQFKANNASKSSKSSHSKQVKSN